MHACKLTGVDFVLSMSGVAVLRKSKWDLLVPKTKEQIESLVQQFPQPYLLLEMNDLKDTTKQRQRFDEKFLFF